VAEEKLGLTFGRVAGAYDRLRPEFAAAAVDYAVASLGLSPRTRALDLAAGTGTLTRALRTRVAEVIAVGLATFEPHRLHETPAEALARHADGTIARWFLTPAGAKAIGVNPEDLRDAFLRGTPSSFSPFGS
jgi:hypothetical protein